jgi:ElaB/YqjD/DUF883 family membrane-anchored ribosome-binding protein
MADYESVLDDISDLSDLLDEVEEKVGTPSAEYVESVRSQAGDMEQWIADHKHATDNQARAVKNWTDGAKRWLRDT